MNTVVPQAVADQLATHIVKEFNPQSVIDLFCGNGLLVQALRKKGVVAYGFDHNEIALDAAPEDIKDFLFYYDLKKLDQYTGLPKYDLLISFGKIHQIPHNDLDAIKLFILNHANRYYFQVPDELQYWREWMESATWAQSV